MIKNEEQALEVEPQAMNKTHKTIIGGITYEAVNDDEHAGCNGCVFKNFEDIDCSCLYCTPLTSKTGRSMIWKRVIKTNGDKIRAMSDEEIAEYQIKRADDCPDVIKPDAPCMVKDNRETQFDCKQCWIEWLKREAEI